MSSAGPSTSAATADNDNDSFVGPEARPSKAEADRLTRSAVAKDLIRADGHVNLAANIYRRITGDA